MKKTRPEDTNARPASSRTGKQAPRTKPAKSAVGAGTPKSPGRGRASVSGEKSTEPQLPTKRADVAMNEARMPRPKKPHGESELRPTQEAIAVRAYEKFCGRGHEHGFHEQDWLAAERELVAESRAQGEGGASAAA